MLNTTNMENLHAIKKPLSELDAMIGMNKLKTNIVDKSCFYTGTVFLIKTIRISCIL